MLEREFFSSCSFTCQRAKPLQGTEGSPGQESRGSCLEHTVCWSHRQTSRECRESTETQQPESQTHHRLSLRSSDRDFSAAGTGLVLPQDSLTSFKGLHFASLKSCLWGLQPKIPTSTDRRPNVLQRSQRAHSGGRSKVQRSSAPAWEIGSWERGGRRVSALPRIVLLFLPTLLWDKIRLKKRKGFSYKV